MVDMLILTVLAVLCGASGWTGVQQFGRAKHKWLKTFLKLPRGIPSHDPLGRPRRCCPRRSTRPGSKPAS